MMLRSFLSAASNLLLLFFLVEMGLFFSYYSWLNPFFLDEFPTLSWLIGLMAAAAMAILCITLLLPARLLSPLRPLTDKIVKSIARSRWIYTAILLAFFIPLLFLAVVRFSSSSALDEPPDLLVLGLDGATWDLIDPLLERGRLPNLQRFLTESASGVLLSRDPMESPSLWTTIATGLPPEEHGVTGFLSTQSDLKKPRVWEICRQQGLSVGLFAWMVTWPPIQPFSFVIPSWFARSPLTQPIGWRFIQEIELDQSLEGGSLDPWSALDQAARHGAHLHSLENLAAFYWQDAGGLDDETRLAKKMLAEPPFLADLFLSLLREYSPHVATFTLYGTDKLAHRFWHYLEPAAFQDPPKPSDPSLAQTIPAYYVEADRALGRILDAVGENTVVVLLSDHGMKADTAMPRRFFLHVPALLQALGVEQQFQYQAIQQQVFFTPLNNDTAAAARLRSLLSDIRFPDGNPLFEISGDDAKIALNTRFSLTWNPDSPLLTNEAILIQGKSLPTRRFFFDRTFSGTHDLHGILALRGPMIIPGHSLNNATLLDVAPTLLYLLNFPIIRDMKGRVLIDAVRKEYVDAFPVQHTDSYQLSPQPDDNPSMDNSLLERLRTLGYVE